MVKEDYFTEKNIQTKSRKFIQELKNLYHFPRLDFDINTSALLIIDMQEYFLNKNSHAFLPSSKAIMPNIKKLIKFFHKKKDL